MELYWHLLIPSSFPSHFAVAAWWVAREQHYNMSHPQLSSSLCVHHLMDMFNKWFSVFQWIRLPLNANQMCQMCRKDVTSLEENDLRIPSAPRMWHDCQSSISRHRNMWCGYDTTQCLVGSKYAKQLFRWRIYDLRLFYGTHNPCLIL